MRWGGHPVMTGEAGGMWSLGGDAWGPGGWGRREGASWSLSEVRASCALLPGRLSAYAGLRGGPGGRRVDTRPPGPSPF